MNGVYPAFPPLRLGVYLVELPCPAIGLQNAAGFVHRDDRILAALQDHTDDIGLGTLGIDAVGRFHGLLHHPAQRLGPGADIGTGNPPFPADIADGAGADQRLHPVCQGGFHSGKGAGLIHHIVKADTGPARRFQARQHILQPLPVQAQTDFGGMEAVPAVQKRLQDIRSVKIQVGDMLSGIQIAQLPIGDPPGDDHIIPLQLPQNLRCSEAMHHIDPGLAGLQLPGHGLHPLEIVRRGHEHDDLYHFPLSFPAGRRNQSNYLLIYHIPVHSSSAGRKPLSISAFCRKKTARAQSEPAQFQEISCQISSNRWWPCNQPRTR